MTRYYFQHFELKSFQKKLKRCLNMLRKKLLFGLVTQPKLWDAYTQTTRLQLIDSKSVYI